MDIKNLELMHECSPEPLRMRTARYKYDKEIREGGTNVEISTVGKKKSRRPNCPKSLNLVQSRQSLTTCASSYQKAVCC